MKRLIGCVAVLCLLALMAGCGGATSTGTLAYISNSNGTGFTVFSVNTDGTLTTADISPIPTPTAEGDGPKVIQFSPNGKWAYFLDNTGLNIYGFVRSGNGSLTTQIDSSGCTLDGGQASSLVISPDSGYLYIAIALTNTDELKTCSIDPATGLIAAQSVQFVPGYPITQLLISSTGGDLFGLAPTQMTVLGWQLTSDIPQQAYPNSVGGITPDYMVLSANGSYMYVLDSSANTSVTSYPGTSCSPTNVCYSPNIYGYHVSGNTLSVPTVYNENPDLLDGAFPTHPISGVTSNDSHYLFVANTSGTVSVFAIESAGLLKEVQGSLTTINGISVSTASPYECGSCKPQFVAIAKANNGLYVDDEVAGEIYQFSVDQNTGVLRALNPAFVTAERAATPTVLSSEPTWITIR